MSHQRRGYAASAAVRAAEMNGVGWPPTRSGERSREKKYSSSKQTYSSKYYENLSDAECSPEPSRARRMVDDHDERRPAPFLYHFDGDDSDSGNESIDNPEHVVSPMRSAYSEPVMLAPRHNTTAPRPQPQPQQHRRPSQPRQYSDTNSLDSTEREALLDRVRQLSSNEAETAASLARATAQNAALLEEVSHWRAVAKEAAASRRAAREALSDVSAENARLAAAYSAQRLEASALQEALHHERSQADARVEELEHALYVAEAKLDAIARKENKDTKKSNQHNLDTSSSSSPTAPPSATTPAPAPRSRATNTATWDQERHDLLSLLERLQEQLAAHAHQQQEAAAQQTPPKRPSSGRGRQAAAGAAGTEQPASTPPRSSTRNTPEVYSVIMEGRTPPSRTQARTPTTATAAAAPGAPRMTPTPVRTKFQMPGSNTTGAGLGSTTKKPTPTNREYANVSSHQVFEEDSITPAPVEPLGVRCEASYESTSATAVPDVDGDNIRSSSSNNHGTTPVASQTPPLSSTRPSSGDARAATTPVHSVPSSTSARPASPAPATTTPKAVLQQQEPSAAELKAVADKLYRHKRYEEALKQYTAALSAAETAAAAAAASTENGSDGNEVSHMVINLLCCRATALAAAGRYLESAADCSRAEKLTLPYGGCPLAIDLRAEAFSLMGAYDLASDDLAKLWQFSSDHNTNSSTNSTSNSQTPAIVARLQDARRAAAGSGPRNHYSILGVKSSATAGEIKSAYRSLALRLHPDKAADALGHDTATLLFSLLSAAHSTLGNTQSRRAYDLQLLRQKYVSGTNTSFRR